MFGTARWRLTLWFTLAFGIILVVIGSAVYLTTRTVLFDRVNSDLESRSGREQRLLLPRLLIATGKYSYHTLMYSEHLPDRVQYCWRYAFRGSIYISNEFFIKKIEQALCEGI